MARPQTLAKDLTAQAAAYLRAEHRLSQEEIGKLLGGLSQSMVSRLLKRAEELGWLKVSYIFVGAERLGAERLTYLRRLVEPKGLVEVLQAIKSATGVRVRELLQRSEVFAVTWGSTVSHVVNALTAAPPPQLATRAVRFVPVCAEP